MNRIVPYRIWLNVLHGIYTREKIRLKAPAKVPSSPAGR